MQAIISKYLITTFTCVGTAQGELAVAFGELLRKLWSSGRTPIAPRQFKGKLARFAPQFSGYNQHDSQVNIAILIYTLVSVFFFLLNVVKIVVYL